MLCSTVGSDTSDTLRPTHVRLLFLLHVSTRVDYYQGEHVKYHVQVP